MPGGNLLKILEAAAADHIWSLDEIIALMDNEHEKVGNLDSVFHFGLCHFLSLRNERLQKDRVVHRVPVTACDAYPS